MFFEALKCLLKRMEGCVEMKMLMEENNVFYGMLIVFIQNYEDVRTLNNGMEGCICNCSRSDRLLMDEVIRKLVINFVHYGCLFSKFKILISLLCITCIGDMAVIRVPCNLGEKSRNGMHGDAINKILKALEREFKENKNMSKIVREQEYKMLNYLFGHVKEECGEENPELNDVIEDMLSTIRMDNQYHLSA